MTGEAFSAWAAGFFDGEGSISIIILKPDNANSIGVRVTINVAQQQRVPLDMLAEKFKGTVHQCGNGNKAIGKPYYKWMLTGRERVTNFLKAIQPYSVVKSAQILTAYECMKLQQPVGFSNKRWYTPETIGQFHILRHRMQTLNANS